MAKTSYLLNAPGADKPTPIFTFLSFGGQRVKVYANRSIHPRQWDATERRALTRGYPCSRALNDWLELLADRLTTCCDAHAAAGTTPTAAELRALAESRSNLPPNPKQASAPPADLLAVFGDWIAGRELTHAPNTLRTYRTALRHLADFQAAARYAVGFDTVGGGFGQRWAEYLLKSCNLRDTVIYKNLTILKTSWAGLRGAAIPLRPTSKR
ncbi:MAG: phage integrase SAM-like domain-containing protein [Hymenobacter sp.]